MAFFDCQSGGTSTEIYTVSSKNSTSGTYPSETYVTLPKTPNNLLVLYFNNVTTNHNRGCVYYDVATGTSQGIGYTANVTDEATYRSTYTITSISGNIATVVASGNWAGSGTTFSMTAVID